MKLCIGEPLSGPGWTGLPLGRFRPPGHAQRLPVAAAQDTLFIWRDGASAAQVQHRAFTYHYRRHSGVFDIMAAHEQARIAHEQPELPGECLLVALPVELREQLNASDPRHRATLASRFGQEDQRVVVLADLLEQHCIEGEPYGKLHTDALSTALLTVVESRYAAHGPAAASRLGPGFSPAQRALLDDYIHEHLDGNFGIAELAGLLGYSAQHFSRVFRRSYGVSAYQHIIDSRIARACHLLVHSSDSLSDIALACGFADQSHFTTLFARRTGRTPQRFRRA